MTILGTVVRLKPERVPAVLAELSRFPGTDVALNPGDGRLVVPLEDTETATAAQNMAAIALLPDVLNLSLVYEYSGPDTLSPEALSDRVSRYQSWRTTLSQMAEGRDAATVSSPIP